MDTSQVRAFRRILRHFTRLTHILLRDCCTEVTLPQCLVLLEVDEWKRLTVGQLASRLRLDDSTLSRTIDSLVRRGLLDRARDDRDRRVVLIGLTREGATTCDEIHEQNDGIVRNVFDKIPPSKRDAVVRNFEVLVQAYLDSESESGTQPACAPTAKEASA
jgi:DNA-binding MarR family transcriptional regulator